MKQAIAGVSPAGVEETPVMTVWPSICAYPSGRFLGSLYSIRWPDLYIFRLGSLLALASIPHALGLFFYRLLPFVGVRYTLTNRRVVVQRGLAAEDDKAIDLDRFEEIEVRVRNGQAWFEAGDLIFKRNGVETFRLEGVSRPEVFRRCCIKSKEAFVGVQEVLGASLK